MFLLSVIIPTYNSELTIERCLLSLTSQKFKDFEVCIIDGISTDKTIDIVCDFRKHFKSLKIIIESDKGIYDAMNKGIDISQGQWLYFLGSDDQIADQNVFADIFKSIISTKLDIIYGSVYISGDTSWAISGQIYDGEFDIHKLLTKNICHQAIFYKKNLFKKFGKYKIQYPVCADWDINLRVFPKSKSLYINRVIADFAGGGISSSVDNEDPIGNDLKKLRRQALMSYRLHRLTSLWTF